MLVGLAAVLTAICSYLLGSLSFAIIVTKLCKGTDIRSFGSGNAGMTNVLRTYGPKYAALTFLGDFLKGVAAVFLGRFIFSFLTSAPPVIGAYIAGMAVVLGHMFPIYYHFKGGKGVLTSASIILIIDPPVCGIIFLVFLLVVAISRYVSLGSISAAVALPIATFFTHEASQNAPLVSTLFAVVLGGIVVYMHRGNIKRLLGGTESKLGSKKKEK